MAALDADAAALGLAVGMGVGEARAMQPGLEVVEEDEAADRRLLEALADWCDRYTPLVAIEGADGLFLDITGCAHLFGGERAMLDDLAARFLEQGFELRAAIASTPGAAWAAARFAGGMVVAHGEEPDLLAPMPLSALRIPPATRRSLESVGLRTAGAVLSTPRAPLARRFGREVLLRLDQALGRAEESIAPRLPVPALMAERPLAEPVTLMEDIEELVVVLARQLCRGLERRAEGVTRLQLGLFRVDGQVSRLAVGASRPLRDPVILSRLVRERLGRLASEIDIGYGFDLVRIAALSTGRLDAAQTGFEGAREERAAGDVALFVDRVQARLGEAAIMAVEAVESHLPERAARAVPWSGEVSAGRPDAGTPHPVADRPARLLTRPECVDVTAAEVPEGPPALFHWRRAGYRVARAEGPERIEPEWWREAGDGAARDYFRVEDGEGRRFWLYREGHYGTGPAPRWFMHGLSA